MARVPGAADSILSHLVSSSCLGAHPETFLALGKLPGTRDRDQTSPWAEATFLITLRGIGQRSPEKQEAIGG